MRDTSVIMSDYVKIILKKLAENLEFCINTYIPKILIEITTIKNLFLYNENNIEIIEHCNTEIGKFFNSMVEEIYEVISILSELVEIGD